MGANITFIYPRHWEGKQTNFHFDRTRIDRYVSGEAIAEFSLFSDFSIETDVTYSLECKSYTCDRSYWQAGGRHI